MFWRRFTQMQARGIAAAGFVSLIGAGFSAHALAPEPVAAPAPTVIGYEAEDHFPGAAYYNAIDDSAPIVATAGTTGTIALPDLPVPENAVIDTSIQPAPPFRLAGSTLDKSRALECLTDAIYYEAANEPTDGQRAVAQVVLNRVRHPAFPGTVCGVVFQGSERRGCQFSFACDGAMARVPARTAWVRASRVAAEALSGSVFAAVGMATHYHTYAVTPVWNRGLVMTGAFGAHFFHRWKGWWGTAAAFRQSYQGAEPMPGPHTPTAPAIANGLAAEIAALPIAPAVKAAAPTPAVAIQPTYAESGTPTAAYSAPSLPESQILDKWKDSGKLLH